MANQRVRGVIRYPGCAEDVGYANEAIFNDGNGCMCQDGDDGLLSVTNPSQVCAAQLCTQRHTVALWASFHPTPHPRFVL